MEKGIQRISIAIVLGFAVLSCKSPEDYARDLELSLTNESKNYQKLIVAQDMHGESVYTALANWTESVIGIATNLTDLSKSMAKLKHDERKEFETSLNRLKEKLEKMCSTQRSLFLAIPRWRYSEAQTLLNELESAWVAMNAAYKKLFKSSLSMDEAPLLDIAVDGALYDTYSDCVSIFNSYNNRDVNCQNIVTTHCGHQMNLDCLKEFAETNWQRAKQEGCTNAYVTKEGEYYEVISTWLAHGIDACRSNYPIMVGN